MNEEVPQKSYYAVIPANIRYDDELPANAKLLYGEITALCNEKGYCWASNDYFAKLYGVSKTSISKWVAALIDKGYIKSELIYKEGTKQILNRYIRIVTYPIEEKLNTPIEEKLKDNNTYINNTINNTYKKECITLGEFNNVILTQEEHNKILDRGYEDKIEDLSIYLKNNPKKKYSSHYATILNWGRKEEKTNKVTPKKDPDYEKRLAAAKRLGL